jgi:hypothetical protein
MGMMLKNKILILLIIIALMAVGCSRYIESEDLDFQLPEQPPIPILLNITHLTDGVNLSWQVSDTVAGMSFRVYYTEDSDTLDENYRLWETTTNYSSIIMGLSPEQIYLFKVASVLPGNIEGAMSVAASSRVGVISVIINNGDLYTNSRSVNVGFVLPGAVSLMQVSEASDFAEANWQTYRAPLGYELSAGDGVKHVYARFRFADGSESDSAEAVRDSIFLDTETGIDSVYFEPAGVTLAMDSVIDFYLVAGEGEGNARISFPSLGGLDLNYDMVNSDTLIGKYVYSRSYTIPANVEAVDALVTGSFTDAAGNRATDVAAPTLLNISNPPTPVTIFAVTESSSSIRLNWSQTIDNDFTAYHIYRDINNSVSETSEAITVITNGATIQYINTGLDESSWYYYRIYVYDNTGKSAASNVDSAFTPINLTPNSVGLAARAEGDSVILTWTANENNDFDSYRIYRDTFVPTSLRVIITDQSTTQYADHPDSSDTYYYNVVVYDEQGKYMLSSWVGDSVTVP